MWEFHCYGGGDLYRDIFNAVALMGGTNAMDSLIRLALVLGVIMALVKAVTDFNVGAILRWYIFAVILYGVLWVPKVSVQVEDRLNPTAVYALVGNVPLGAAVPAALISQVGDRIIQLTQTSFGDPADSNYSDHGMVFGAKMFAKINGIRPADQLVTLNMSSYMKNCAFYDIQDNTVNLDALSKSGDMWATLTASPNPARLAPYTLADGTSSLKPCDQMRDLVKAGMDADAVNEQKILMSSLDSSIPEGTMATTEDNVSAMMAAAMGSGQDSLNILRQAVTRNMLNDSMKGYMGDSNGVLAASIADVQTQNTQKLLGNVAEKAVVNLKIVIELLFIGIFPAIFPLFLLPKLGPAMAKGYMAGFFYLQLWGPMYVILHKIMMWNSYNHMMSASFQPGGGHVINALSLDAVAQANQDVCSLAGSMMLMIPVLAGLLTKGAMAVGAQGEALLGNFRSGAEAASNMETTGNYSFDNSSMGNHSWSNENANQHVTSAMYDQDRSTRVGADGGTVTSYGGGYQTMKMDLSSGALDLNRGNVAGETLRKSAQSWQEDSQNFQQAYSTGISKAQTVMSEVSSGHQVSTTTAQGLSNEENGSISRVMNDQAALSNHLQQQYGLSKSEADAEATKASMAAYADAHVGGNFGPAGGASAGVKGEASKDSSTTGTKTYSDDKTSQLTQNLSRDISDGYNKIATSQAQASYNHANESFSGTRNASSDSFSSVKSMTDTLSRMNSAGHRISAEAEGYRSGTQAVSMNDTQDFYRWARENGKSKEDIQGWFKDTPEAREGLSGALQGYWGSRADDLGKKYMEMASPGDSASTAGMSSGVSAMAPVINDEQLSAAMQKAEGGQAQPLAMSATGLNFSDGSPLQAPAAMTLGEGHQSAATTSAPHTVHHTSNGHHGANGHSTGAHGHSAHLTAAHPASSSGPVDFGGRVPSLLSHGYFGVFGSVDSHLQQGEHDKSQITTDVHAGAQQAQAHKVDTQPTIMGALGKTAHKTQNWWGQDDSQFFGGLVKNTAKGYNSADGH